MQGDRFANVDEDTNDESTTLVRTRSIDERATSFTDVIHRLVDSCVLVHWDERHLNIVVAQWIDINVDLDRCVPRDRETRRRDRCRLQNRLSSLLRRDVLTSVNTLDSSSNQRFALLYKLNDSELAQHRRIRDEIGLSGCEHVYATNVLVRNDARIPSVVNFANRSDTPRMTVVGRVRASNNVASLARDTIPTELYASVRVFQRGSQRLSRLLSLSSRNFANDREIARGRARDHGR